MSKSEWRPKVGERVLVEGAVLRVAGTEARLQIGTEWVVWSVLDDLSPLPAPDAPREPWVVLREAHKLMLQEKPGSWYGDILDVAKSLEAAAAPKPPPTLAEAVRAFLEAPECGELHTLKALREALTRAEAGQ